MPEKTIAIQLTPYLKEWFIHENGGSYPVKLIRESQESIIVKCFLKPRTEDAKCRENANCLIYLPNYKGLDIRKFDYLPPRAILLLENAIMNRFKIQLWKELYTLDKCNADVGLSVSAFMEKHGISGVKGDTNWESIRQLYYRMRKVYENKISKKV